MPLEIRELTRSLGAEVVGLDPRRDIDAEVQRTLRAALDRHDLLLLREVDFDETEQARFAGIFGAPAPLPMSDQRPQVPQTQYVSNTRSDGLLPAGELAYHQDHLFDAEPVRVIVLYGLEVPSAGGATKFRSCREIYRRMDEPLKQRARSVRCLHLFDFEGAANVETGKINPWDRNLRDEKYSPFSLEDASPNAPRNWTPLIWRNPATGIDVAWCNHGTTVAFDGLRHRDGKALLDEIADRAEGVEEYVHIWKRGDVVLWNNLTLQHARLPFDSSEKRSLRRSTLL